MTLKLLKSAGIFFLLFLFSSHYTTSAQWADFPEFEETNLTSSPSPKSDKIRHLVKSFQDAFYNSSLTDSHFRSKLTGDDGEKVEKYIIRQDSAGLKFGTLTYYWDGFSPDNKNVTSNWCKYTFDQNDVELMSVLLENKTAPKFLKFDCSELLCCGFECCKPDSVAKTDNSWIMGLIFLFTCVSVAIFAGVYKIYQDNRTSAVSPAFLYEMPVFVYPPVPEVPPASQQATHNANQGGSQKMGGDDKWCETTMQTHSK